MQSTFAVRAELKRRRMLDEQCQRERGAGEMVERRSLSQPAIAKPLRLLRGGIHGWSSWWPFSMASPSRETAGKRCMTTTPGRAW